MKVAIILFSPTGNTLKAGEMLQKRLMDINVEVQVIDISRSKSFGEKNIGQYLEENIKEHDLLCIGSPVYAHHLHYNVKEIIKSLPQPKKKWGGLAVPFITFGGINSGVALKEAADLLKKSGRTVVSAMKLNSEHCLTKLKQITTKINEGMPGVEAVPVIEELVGKIAGFENINENDYVDISNKLDYQDRKVRIKACLVFREKFWQRYIYPKLVFDYDKCTNCGKCSRICPVQRIKINGKGPEIPKGSPECIHCGSCVTACPFSAIDFNVDWVKWEKLLSKAARGEGPIASNESPKSEVY